MKLKTFTKHKSLFTALLTNRGIPIFVDFPKYRKIKSLIKTGYLIKTKPHASYSAWIKPTAKLYSEFLKRGN